MSFCKAYFRPSLAGNVKLKKGKEGLALYFKRKIACMQHYSIITSLKSRPEFTEWRNELPLTIRLKTKPFETDNNISYLPFPIVSTQTNLPLYLVLALAKQPWALCSPCFHSILQCCKGRISLAIRLRQKFVLIFLLVPNFPQGPTDCHQLHLKNVGCINTF